MCMDTTIIQYPDDSKANEAQKREKDAAEAKRYWMERKAQQNKQNTQTIKLKD